MGFENKNFTDYFSGIYGKRWENIFLGLQAPLHYIYRQNQFADPHNFDFSILQNFPAFKNSFRIALKENLQNEIDRHGISLFYKMDPASQFVAEALHVQTDQKVLDMCAAPGGKSLVLSEKLFGTGELICNEISKDRRERLNRVIHQYIPYEYRQNIFVKGLDGNQYGLKYPNYFDAVLCDAPCSGERHLLENLKEFELWTLKRSKNLAMRQFSLLSSAWLACRPGGRIVYSTCSISPSENDDVVKKLIKRREVQVLRKDEIKKFDFIESTECGYQILPDIAGFGPMFFSILLKI